MKILSKLIASLRMRRWRKKLKADRGFSLRLRNPSLFLQRLAEQEVRYLVLRWYDELPAVLSQEKADDVDILVEHGSLPRIAAAIPLLNFFGKKRDKVKFDLYSDSGRGGLSYRKMPYYPPVRARHLLDNRVLDPRGWYRIAARDYLPALVYHLTYHKRQTSGWRMHPDSSDASRLPAKKDYPALLQEEAAREGYPLPALNSLHEAHHWLRDQGWGMPFDLIRRWPDQDAWLQSLYAGEAEALGTLDAPEDLVVLVTRQEAIEHGCEDDIVQRLRPHGEILETYRLQPAQTRALLWWARGGNWLASKQYSLSEPCLLIKCRIAKDAAQVKEQIRKDLSKRHGKQNWLHGTDDIDEARYYLALAEGQHYRDPVQLLGGVP